MVFCQFKLIIIIVTDTATIIRLIPIFFIQRILEPDFIPFDGLNWQQIVLVLFDCVDPGITIVYKKDTY